VRKTKKVARARGSATVEDLRVTSLRRSRQLKGRKAALTVVTVKQFGRESERVASSTQDRFAAISGPGIPEIRDCTMRPSRFWPFLFRGAVPFHGCISGCMFGCRTAKKHPNRTTHQRRKLMGGQKFYRGFESLSQPSSLNCCK